MGGESALGSELEAKWAARKEAEEIKAAEDARRDEEKAKQDKADAAAAVLAREAAAAARAEAEAKARGESEAEAKRAAEEAVKKARQREVEAQLALEVSGSWWVLVVLVDDCRWSRQARLH